MSEYLQPNIMSVEEAARPSSAVIEANPAETLAEPGNLPTLSDDVHDADRHARAGREGARRVHQLIREGKLYEQEHGLKRGRQRLRQLIELGKLYEQEHGLRPVRPKKRAQRLSRLGRQELLATLLECLVRIARPSFRQELVRLIERMKEDPDGHAA